MLTTDQTDVIERLKQRQQEREKRASDFLQTAQQQAQRDKEQFYNQSLISALNKGAAQVGSIGGKIADTSATDSMQRANELNYQASIKAQDEAQKQFNADINQGDDVELKLASLPTEFQSKNIQQEAASLALDRAKRDNTAIGPEVANFIKSALPKKYQDINFENMSADNPFVQKAYDLAFSKQNAGLTSSGRPIVKDTFNQQTGQTEIVQYNPDGSTRVLGIKGYAPGQLGPRNVGYGSGGQGDMAVSQQQLGARKVSDSSDDIKQSMRQEIMNSNMTEFEKKTALKDIYDERDRIRKDTKDYSEAVNKSGYPAMKQRISEIKELIPESGSVPGFGGIKNSMPEFLLSPEGRQLRQRFQDLFNIVLKERSGAAVTVDEMERLKKAFGAGTLQTADQLREGLRSLESGLDASFQNTYGGYDPRVKQLYQKQGGYAPATQRPTTNTPETSSGFSLDAIKAERARRGKAGT